MLTDLSRMVKTPTSHHDNLSDTAATYAVGGMATHWTAAVPRQHPKVETPSIIDDEEWQFLYEESAKRLKKSDDLFQNPIRNTVVKEDLSNNNNKLYLHDHNKVLQHCKSYLK